jgi:hypothetical protein
MSYMPNAPPLLRRPGYRCPICGTPGYACGGPTFMPPSPVYQTPGGLMEPLIEQTRTDPDSGFEYVVQVTQQEADDWTATQEANAQMLAAQEAQRAEDAASAPAAERTKTRSPKATGDVATK